MRPGDPAFPQQFRRFLEVLSPESGKAFQGNIQGAIAKVRNCLELTLGLPSPIKDIRQCVRDTRFPDRVDETLRDELVRRFSRSSYLKARLSDFENFWIQGNPESIDDGQLRNLRADFGDKPVVVLSRSAWYDADEGFSAAEQSRIFAAWIAGHEALAKSSRRGKQVVIPDSGHWIQMDQPGAVIDAIRGVVQDVRQLQNTTAHSESTAGRKLP